LARSAQETGLYRLPPSLDAMAVTTRGARLLDRRGGVVTTTNEMDHVGSARCSRDGAARSSQLVRVRRGELLGGLGVLLRLLVRLHRETRSRDRLISGCLCPAGGAHGFSSRRWTRRMETDAPEGTDM
jgi:hypothetical protein